MAANADVLDGRAYLQALHQIRSLQQCQRADLVNDAGDFGICCCCVCTLPPPLLALCLFLDRVDAKAFGG